MHVSFISSLRHLTDLLSIPHLMIYSHYYDLKTLINYCRSDFLFVSFYFSRISRGGQIRKFKNLTKINIIIAVLKKNENSRILICVQSLKVRNSPKFKHAKMPNLQYLLYKYVPIGLKYNEFSVISHFTGLIIKLYNVLANANNSKLDLLC